MKVSYTISQNLGKNNCKISKHCFPYFYAADFLESSFQNGDVLKQSTRLEGEGCELKTKLLKDYAKQLPLTGYHWAPFVIPWGKRSSPGKQGWPLFMVG